MHRIDNNNNSSPTLTLTKKKSKFRLKTSIQQFLSNKLPESASRVNTAATTDDEEYTNRDEQSNYSVATPHKTNSHGSPIPSRQPGFAINAPTERKHEVVPCTTLNESVTSSGDTISTTDPVTNNACTVHVTSTVSREDTQMEITMPVVCLACNAT
ncbi:hypothetical protein (Partial), partial [Seminavis robusta]|eukprot:Sro4040_g352640.1 n/a (155) ;mRNA; r:147-611